jgi:hypothetical protein
VQLSPDGDGTVPLLSLGAHILTHNVTDHLSCDPVQESGVQLSPDGDGTVPLLSLGALCAGGWRTRRLNPSGLKVVLREYPHKPGPVLKDTR